MIGLRMQMRRESFIRLVDSGRINGLMDILFSNADDDKVNSYDIWRVSKKYDLASARWGMSQ